jgi:hypothetical protein
VLIVVGIERPRELMGRGLVTNARKVLARTSRWAASDRVGGGEPHPSIAASTNPG